MKILILSCNTGEGHNSAAKAINHYFEKSGDECVMADALAFVSPSVSKLVASGHVFIYRHLPDMFDIVYKGAEVFAKKESSPHDSMIFKLLALGAKDLFKYITDGSFDKIVCFHPFAAQMLTKVYRDHPEARVPTYIIATDYTCSPGAGESKLDTYFIPHESVTDEFVSRGVARAKIVPVGIPVSERFCDLPSREDARAFIGVPNDKNVILLMSGSMGAGHVDKIAKKMASSIDDDTMLIVVCGRNEHLYRDLSQLEGKYDNVRVLGFTDKITQYMSAADILVTKPGGLSSTEAACVRLPMVMIDAVAGCETYNLKFFVDGGYAYSASNIDELVSLSVNLVHDKAELQRIRDKMAENFSADTAYKIYKYIKEGQF